MGTEVTRISEGDIPEVVETLAQGFFDDPIFRWWLPAEGRRKEILPEFFGLVVETYLPGGEIYRTGDGVAAAVWAPPGIESSEEETAQFMSAVGEVTGEYAETAFEIFEALEAKHPTDSHSYLFLLAARPGFQGRGLGSALLREVLDGCDRTGVPAYLEATCADNRRLYERHGFVTTGEITVRDSPPLYPMWREPR